MRKIPKKPVWGILLSAVIFCILILLAGAFAKPEYAPAGSFFVSDYGGVLSAAVENQIAGWGQELETQTGVWAAVVTVPELQGEPPDQLAGRLLNRWGREQADEEVGVLILLAAKENLVCAAVGRGLGEILSPEQAEQTLQQAFAPYQTSGDPSAGMLESYRAVAALTEQCAAGGENERALLPGWIKQGVVVMLAAAAAFMAGVFVKKHGGRRTVRRKRAR